MQEIRKKYNTVLAKNYELADARTDARTKVYWVVLSLFFISDFFYFSYTCWYIFPRPWFLYFLQVEIIAPVLQRNSGVFPFSFFISSAFFLFYYLRYVFYIHFFIAYIYFYSTVFSSGGYHSISPLQDLGLLIFT